QELRAVGRAVIVDERLQVPRERRVLSFHDGKPTCALVLRQVERLIEVGADRGPLVRFESAHVLVTRRAWPCCTDECAPSPRWAAPCAPKPAAWRRSRRRRSRRRISACYR